MKYVAIAIGVYILIKLSFMVGKEAGKQEIEKEFTFILKETINTLVDMNSEEDNKDPETLPGRTEMMSKLAEQMAKEGYSNEDILKALDEFL